MGRIDHVRVKGNRVGADLASVSGAWNTSCEARGKNFNFAHEFER
jgi:hypothetical protein